ncbi:MAG: ankyrin repeat domain-containing protein [Halopseudomonas sp.]
MSTVTNAGALIRQVLVRLTLSLLFISHAAHSASSDFDLLLTTALTHDRTALQQHLADGNSLDLHDARGRSLVLRVTMKNDMKALQLLIELGADVDYFNPALAAGVIDQTAFLYAGAKGVNPALQLLIDAGARADIYNYYGGTALIPAAEKGHIATVKLLLEKSQVDINHVNNLGWTALMEAVLLSDGGPQHQQIIALLLAHGADPNITDLDGISALQHAQNKGYRKIVELLQQQQQH